MLIEFSVGNFRSFNERQQFSLVKARGDELADTNTFIAEAASNIELLRSAAIYGPNAGGKSNFIRALSTMAQTVRSSASQQRGDKLATTPFLLAQDSATAPSEFEIVFIKDRVRYQYGFSISAERVHEEWLYAFPHKRAQRWFEREWNSSTDSYRWVFGNQLQGEKQLWQKSTRNNALFLSTAVQLNSLQLQPVYDWFNQTLRIVNLGGVPPRFSAELCCQDKKASIIEFIKSADIGIEDILVSKSPFDPQRMLPEDSPESTREKISQDMKGKEIIDEIKTVHRNNQGKAVEFDFDDESDGTKKLFSFAGPWIDTLESGYVLFIDELHDNLHPSLVKFLVELFHNPITNPRNAQLVFTTHETAILSQSLLRRDQIWFCEKGADQASSLYPLTDFSPRKGRENLEQAYLAGRYGALPYLRQFSTPAQHDHH